MPRKKPIRKSALDRSIYSPHIPLGMVYTVDPETFEPILVHKSRTRKDAT